MQVIVSNDVQVLVSSQLKKLSAGEFFFNAVAMLSLPSHGSTSVQLLASNNRGMDQLRITPALVVYKL